MLRLFGFRRKKRVLYIPIRSAEQLKREVANAQAARAKKGKVADLGFKPIGVVRME